MADKNLPDKADELLTEVVNKDPLTLAAISAIPYFGGTVATFFSAKWLEVYQERTAELFRQFSEHLSDIDEQSIRRDYFDTPEGTDLLIKATEASGKTRSTEKRDLIARVLTGATTDNRREYSPEEYLSLLSDLTTKELRTARLLYEDRPEPKPAAWTPWTEKACIHVGYDKEDLQMALARLGSVGLVSAETIYNTDDGDLAFLSRTDGEGWFYIVTPVFEKLMQFLALDA